jgi:hypothetical protein
MLRYAIDVGKEAKLSKLSGDEAQSADGTSEHLEMQL